MKLNTKALADVEIGIPVIADGVYHARMEKPEVKANKTGDGNNLVIMFRILDNPVFLRKDGKEIANNGQVVNTRYFSLKPTDNYDPDKNLKELAVAIRHPADKDLDVEDLKDKVVMIKVEYKEATEAKDGKKGYPEGNDIRRITPVPEDDTFQLPPF
jgi:hypothetical protein